MCQGGNGCYFNAKIYGILKVMKEQAPASYAIMARLMNRIVPELTGVDALSGPEFDLWMKSQNVEYHRLSEMEDLEQAEILAQRLPVVVLYKMLEVAWDSLNAHFGPGLVNNAIAEFYEQEQKASPVEAGRAGWMDEVLNESLNGPEDEEDEDDLEDAA